MSAPGKWNNVVSKLLFEDPRFFVFDTLPKQNQTRFLITTEAELSKAPFTDIRFDDRSHEDVYASSQQLLKYSRKHAWSEPNTYFIFHHAFVCSTLLARCLNQIDAFYSLKEPWILRRIADLKRKISISAKRRDWQEKSRMHLRLLCKPYKSGKSLVIKPTNVANNIIADVCQWLPRSKVLYLYSDLEPFLVSNLKKTNETKAKIPGLLQEFLLDSDIAVECRSLTGFNNLTFLQCCAAIWIANTYALKEQCGPLPSSRVQAINMDRLLQAPESSLTTVSQFFDHTPTATELSQLTSADVLGFHAKASIPRSFNTQLRAQEYDQILRPNKTDISAAIEWAEPVIRSLHLREFLQQIELSQEYDLTAVMN